MDSKSLGSFTVVLPGQEQVDRGLLLRCQLLQAVIICCVGHRVVVAFDRPAIMMFPSRRPSISV